MNRYRKSFPSKRIGVQLLKRTGAYAFLMFAVCFAIFFFLNQSSIGADLLQNQQVNAGQMVDSPSVAPTPTLTTSPASTPTPTPTLTPTPSPTPPPAATPNPAVAVQNAIKITGVPGDAQIVFSYDDQYSSYLYKSQIVVIGIKEDKVIQTIKDNGIAWMNFMNNRDIVLYFTVQNNTLALDTYNIATGQAANQMSINLPSGSKLKGVDDSSATNLIYVNVEQKAGGKTSDSVYYVNILKNMQQVPLATNEVNSMVLLNKSNTLYSEDGQNNLYLNGKPFAGLKTGMLIGCDVKDNVYVQSVSEKNSVSVITNQKMVGTMALNDPNVLCFYADKSNIYAVYSDYIINLSKDLNAKLPYDKSLKFVGIGGTYAYFRNTDNNITALELNI